MLVGVLTDTVSPARAPDPMVRLADDDEVSAPTRLTGPSRLIRLAT